jgi:hypothetical protein
MFAKTTAFGLWRIAALSRRRLASSRFGGFATFLGMRQGQCGATEGIGCHLLSGR